MAYMHTVRCPKTHEWIDVCTEERYGYEMGKQFEFECPLCGETHHFVALAVEIQDEVELCPPGVPEGHLSVNGRVTVL